MMLRDLVLVILSVLCALASGKVDKTKERSACSAAVRDAVVSRFSTKCIFKDDHLLSVLYASTSNCNSGTGGMWKVDRVLFELTKTDASVADLRTSIQTFIDRDWPSIPYGDLDFPELSFLAMRMIMQMSSAAIPLDTANQLTYLRDTLKSTETITAADLNTRKNDLSYQCKMKKADVVFLVDASGSVGSDSFKQALDFLARVVDSFTIGEKATRVGMVRYSNDAERIFSLDRYDNKDDIMSAIRSVRYTEGSTYTNRGLDEAWKVFDSASTRKFKTKQILIVLTDGKSSDGPKTIESAREVRDKGIKVIALGIGDGVDVAELNDIGSSPRCKHVHFLSSFSDTENFVSQLKLETCKASSFVQTKQVISGELALGESIEFQYDVKDTDLDPDTRTFTLELLSPVGAVSALVSTYPNPNEASYDFTMQASVDGGAVGNLDLQGTAGTTSVYISVTGMDNLNQFSVYAVAPPTGQLSFVVLITCLFMQIARM